MRAKPAIYFFTQKNRAANADFNVTSKCSICCFLVQQEFL